MNCVEFLAGRCHSCNQLSVPYPEQLAKKQQQLATLMAPFAEAQLLPAVASREDGFRTKAKMVVSGSKEQPVLGILNDGVAVDLSACPLYPAAFAPAFSLLKGFIQRAALTPYQVEQKQGELKLILLSQSQASGRVMLRFVLRSKNCLASIQKHLPWLQQQWPELAVCSVNLQPVHMAVLEGPEEILLTSEELLREELNGIPLYLTPQSFFQTNTAVAAALYATAEQWAEAIPGQRLWDLFCGVGGFGLHLARAGRWQLTGIEIAPKAIASATRSASELGLSRVSFQALDAAAFAKASVQAPDLLVVNPPRRGLGAALCQSVMTLQPAWLMYSSCNPDTLARDLAWLNADYRLLKVQLFDMFPHTEHAEVLTLLQKRSL
ncbi:23S rRNA (uracil(747)-C(5))-methyltransferase RlmC [Rheinheimera mesophila]|uniref:23S rRNA (uracil(747)-C(5))-methyltransferase RlmC n=1 Tax=Rheinheimera mesophila TaxID=1547515 RepID=A0A3P3QE42_9GAMM|nr:23S rRNA (uracil(747)-C(5))-methyltransferase RlmC [Rheinheimera mesophila]KKL03054.1 23S rRNA methyltransferase [Rheinheimera mesophila]RRJ19466.1 23S rRNA (uracil(747)-C(5))-methyltransferase RlmC [Rheinheimera mesophila]